MADNVIVLGQIDTTSELDTYPTHNANKGKGGYVVVESDINEIPLDRRDYGQVIFVKPDIESNPDYPYGYEYRHIENLEVENPKFEFPVTKIKFSSSSPTIDSGNITDIVITNDYVYFCVKSYINSQDKAIWKKLALTNL